jgi:hypothetical protein
MATDLNLFICFSRELEGVRRHSCAYQSIPPFVAQFVRCIDGRTPGLVFSMHEMLLSGRNLFPVLTAVVLPLVEAETILPRITGVCTVSPGGTVFCPMIILNS